MKKKILISSLAIIMILTMCVMAFAGCKDKLAELDPNFAIPTAHIGANGGTLSDDAVQGGIQPINNDMSSFEMLQVGMSNFYNANYAVIEYSGGVKMTLAGTINVNQVVQSTKIRDGLGDASGNNENGATYFADNKSHSGFAKIYEKFVITPNSWERKAADKGDISFYDTGEKITKGDKKGELGGRLGEWYIKDNKFGGPTDYKNLNDLVVANSNNPTILWMYDLQEEFIIDSFAPVYDEDEKCYKIGFIFDKDKSTVEYMKVMEVQLRTNAGMDIKGLQFEQLLLEVVLWENGMIRAINVNEVYHMKMQLTSAIGIDSNVNLKATQLFSYDRNEEGYKIADHINAF